MAGVMVMENNMVRTGYGIINKGGMRLNENFHSVMGTFSLAFQPAEITASVCTFMEISLFQTILQYARVSMVDIRVIGTFLYV